MTAGGRVLRLLLSLLLAAFLVPQVSGYALEDEQPTQEVQEEAISSAAVATESANAQETEATVDDTEQPAETQEPQNLREESGFATLSEAEEAGAAAALPDDPDAYVESEVIVVLAGESGESRELAAVEESLVELSVEEGTVETEVLSPEPDGSSMVLVDLPSDVSVADALLQLANDESVAFVQPNFRYSVLDDEPSTVEPLALEPLYTTNDPNANDVYQWWLGAVNAYSAWDKKRTEGAVTVAIIDTGVRLTHQDLDDNILTSLAWDAYRGKLLTASVSAGQISNGGDVQGHGTHVAGIVAAEANNGKDGAGVSYNAKILPINVFYIDSSNKVTATTVSVRSAFDYIIAHKDDVNIRVVNMSIGGYEAEDNDTVLHNKIKEATGKGILSVVSAGNYGGRYASNAIYFVNGDYQTGDNKPCYPSDYDEVISVTSVTRDLAWTFSDHNANKDIAAPGTDIYSTTFNSDSGDNSMGSKSGTSMSAPIVSGIAALLFAKDPTLTPAQVKELLYNTAVDKGDPGWDKYYGWGVVNARAALDAIDEEYTVTLNANGGTVSPMSVKVAYNTAVGTLPTPTRTGCAFEGWYTAASGGTKIAVTTEVTANVTYYAHWAADGFDNAVVTIASPLAPSRVFDVVSGSAANGARIQLYQTNTTPAQRFRMERVLGTNYYVIKNVKSGKVIDVSAGRASNGTAIQQYVANDTAAQKWKLVPATGDTYTIVSALSESMVLDLPGASSASGTKLQLYQSNGTAAQRFTLNTVTAFPGLVNGGTYTISASSGKVLDVAGGSTASGANLQIYQSNGTGAQKFKVSYDGATGYYTITNTKANKPLDVAGAGTANGTNVHIYQSNGTWAQRWTIVPGATSGTYVLYAACSGLTLDVAGNGSANGTNVQTYVANGTPAQAWKFNLA